MLRVEVRVGVLEGRLRARVAEGVCLSATKAMGREGTQGKGEEIAPSSQWLLGKATSLHWE